MYTCINCNVKFLRDAHPMVVAIDNLGTLGICSEDCCLRMARKITELAEMHKQARLKKEGEY